MRFQKFNVVFQPLDLFANPGDDSISITFAHVRFATEYLTLSISKKRSIVLFGHEITIQ